MSAVSCPQPEPRHVTMLRSMYCACHASKAAADVYLGGEPLTFSALAQPQRPLRCTCPSLSCSAHKRHVPRADMQQLQRSTPEQQVDIGTKRCAWSPWQTLQLHIGLGKACCAPDQRCWATLTACREAVPPAGSCQMSCRCTYEAHEVCSLVCTSYPCCCLLSSSHREKQLVPQLLAFKAAESLLGIMSCLCLRASRSAEPR